MDQIHAPAANSNPANGMVLNSLELTSIHALVAYTAYEKKVSEEAVRQTLLARFGVDDMKNFPGAAFDDAIRFLVDLQDVVILN